MPVQAARSSAPREVADEVRDLEKRKRNKITREEASMKAKVRLVRPSGRPLAGTLPHVKSMVPQCFMAVPVTF